MPGDGIGPEIAECVEAAFDKLKVPIVFERFPHIHGARNGLPVEEVDEDLLESVRKNKVCFKGTLFTPLSATNTSTQSYNVRLRKALDLHINLVQVRVWEVVGGGGMVVVGVWWAAAAA